MADQSDVSRQPKPGRPEVATPFLIASAGMKPPPAITVEEARKRLEDPGIDVDAWRARSDEWRARLRALDTTSTKASVEVKRFLTVQETADVLGCSTKTVYRRIEDKTLKATRSKPRAPFRIDRADLEAYVDAHSTAPSVHDIEPWQS